MNCIRDTYIGAITAITYSPDEQMILYGSGKSIWIYENDSYQQKITFPVLHNATIHGIRFHNDIMCVFGQREFVLFNWREMVDSQFQSIHPLYEWDHFVDWIWDVCILEPSTQLAIGTAHNSVIIWDTVQNKPIQCYYGKERCILYSMSILNLNGSLLVASGTVFTEVHIWSVCHPEHTHICKKHNGVIFKVRWNQDGRYLLSVSDDRSMVVWKHSISSEPWWVSVNTTIEAFLSGEYHAAHQCYGHTARLWDCLFTPSCLVTASEDCTVRFWSPEGTCIAGFGGHKGKHIWCLGYDAKNHIVLTGGNDNSIKIWNVDSIVHSSQMVTTKMYTIPTMIHSNPNEPRNSKSECIRDVSVSADGKDVFVASNWGYVWRFRIQEEKWYSVVTPDLERVGFQVEGGSGSSLVEGGSGSSLVEGHSENSLVEGHSENSLVEGHSEISLERNPSKNTSTMALDKQNTVVAAGNSSGLVRILSLTNTFPVQEFRPCSVRISKLVLTEENDDYLWIFIIAADSTIYLYQLNRHTGQLFNRSTLHCVTKGVAISLLWIRNHNCLVVSDSLGTIHFNQFEWKEDKFHCCQSASVRCHSLVPVCCLAWHEEQVWTGGNDGKLTCISVSWDPLTLSVNTPLTVPQIKQILSVWWTEEGEVCCAGYHESHYCVYDVTNMVEVLTIPAGGWKRPSSNYSNPQHPIRGYTYVYASMNGFSDICVFRKYFEDSAICSPSLNTPSHGREINVVHWLEASEEGGVVATGGEDRKLQLVEMTKAQAGFDWSILQTFEVHSSCIRAITSCRLNDDRGYLLLSCGGRNTICVWTVLDGTYHCKLQASYPFRNSMNCSEEGDQRIMDVAVIASSSQSCYYFGTGDSFGRFHLYCIRDNAFFPQLLYTSEIHTTPVLSVEIVKMHSSIVVIAGVAAGDLISMDLTSAIANYELGKNFDVTPSLFALFPAIHVMGINDLKVLVEGNEMCCVTVGDDQSMRVTCLKKKEEGIVCVQKECEDLIAGTSLRGLAAVGNYLFTTGWEQKVQQWCWRDRKLVRLGEMNVQVPETGSIDCISNGTSVLGCVCGDMGFEVFESLL